MLNNTDDPMLTWSNILLNSSNYDHCLEKFSISQWHFLEFFHTLAYILSAASLFPQIIHLQNYRVHVVGISYIWIIMRGLAFITLIIGHGFTWLGILEFVALISTLVIFLQIISFSNHLHRKNKLILIMISSFLWINGGILSFFLRMPKSSFINIGYLLLAIHVLPQVRSYFIFQFKFRFYLSARFYSIHFYEQPRLYQIFRYYY